jgi:hypothetical protein
VALVKFRIPADVYISGSGQFNSSLTASAISASSVTASLYTGSFKGDGSQLTGINATATVNPNSNISFNSTYGIIFSQNVIGGNIQANKLDDYEEGTWTPTFSSFTGNNPVVVTSKYVKIGALVYITVSLTLNGTANTSGTATISLPFTCNVNTPGYMVATTAAKPLQGLTLSANTMTLGAFTTNFDGRQISAVYFTNS